MGGTDQWLLSEASNGPWIRWRCEGRSGLRTSTCYCFGHGGEAAEEVAAEGGAAEKTSQESGAHSCVGEAVASEVGH